MYVPIMIMSLEVLKSSFSNKNVPEISLNLEMLRPGFEPGSTAREAVILGPHLEFDRTILPEPQIHCLSLYASDI